MTNATMILNFNVILVYIITDEHYLKKGFKVLS